MRVARRVGGGSALVARACGACLLLRGTARAHDSARTGLLSWSPNAPSLWRDFFSSPFESLVFLSLTTTMSESSQTPATLPVTCSLKSISLEDDIPMCRICCSTGGKQGGQEPLRRVCLCKGSMGEIHKSCLETWLTAAHADRCPVCHYEFQIRRVFKPITQVSTRI